MALFVGGVVPAVVAALEAMNLHSEPCGRLPHHYFVVWIYPPDIGIAEAVRQVVKLKRPEPIGLDCPP